MVKIGKRVICKEILGANLAEATIGYVPANRTWMTRGLAMRAQEIRPRILTD